MAQQKSGNLCTKDAQTNGTIVREVAEPGYVFLNFITINFLVGESIEVRNGACDSVA